MSDSPMTSPISKEESEQGCELEAVKFIPLGHAMNMLLEEKYSDKDEYSIHASAAAKYLEKHPILVPNYRNLLIAGGREMAQSIVESAERYVSDHIVFVELALKESYDEADKKMDTIIPIGIKRDTLLDTVMKTFTVPEDQIETLANAMFNLINYSGAAFALGTDTRNPTGSVLQIHIFNF